MLVEGFILLLESTFHMPRKYTKRHVNNQIHSDSIEYIPSYSSMTLERARDMLWPLVAQMSDEEVFNLIFHSRRFANMVIDHAERGVN